MLDRAQFVAEGHTLEFLEKEKTETKSTGVNDITNPQVRLLESFSEFMEREKNGQPHDKLPHDIPKTPREKVVIRTFESFMEKNPNAGGLTPNEVSSNDDWEEEEE